MVLKYFGSEVRFSNFMFKALLIFTIGQQVYYPQELKYLHLALLFITFLFADIIHEDYRNVKSEYYFLGTIFALSSLSIIDYYTSFSFNILYLALIAIAIIQVSSFVRNIIIIVKKNEIDKIAENNLDIIKKGSKFVVGLMSVINITIIIGLAYVLFEIIKTIFF